MQGCSDSVPEDQAAFLCHQTLLEKSGRMVSNQYLQDSMGTAPLQGIVHETWVGEGSPPAEGYAIGVQSDPIPWDVSLHTLHRVYRI